MNSALSPIFEVSSGTYMLGVIKDNSTHKLSLEEIKAHISEHERLKSLSGKLALDIVELTSELKHATSHCQCAYCEALLSKDKDLMQEHFETCRQHPIHKLNLRVQQLEQAVQCGLEYAGECLAVHERSLGRTTPKNKGRAEQMELDIANMKSLIHFRNEEQEGAHEVT